MPMVKKPTKKEAKAKKAAAEQAALQLNLLRQREEPNEGDYTDGEPSRS